MLQEIFPQIWMLIAFIIIAIITDVLAKRKNWQWSLIGPATVITGAILFHFNHYFIFEDINYPYVVYFLPFVIYLLVLSGVIENGRKKYTEQQQKELVKMKAKDIK